MTDYRKLWPILALVPLAMAALAAACGDGDSIEVGGALTDPAAVPTATPFAEPPSPIFLEEGAITPSDGGGGGGQPGVCGNTYVVESGDSFFAIAQKCEVDLDALRQANPGVEPTALQVGQELKLPPKEE